MPLKIGDPAPRFSVPDQDGKIVSLEQLKGKKVVLYFYPKDQTPGCTAESCNLRDNYPIFQKKGYEILGISSDSMVSHQKFIAKEKLPFRLLADEDKKVHNLFGTWVEKSMYGRKYMGTARVTFIIDENGIIENIFDKVDTANHSQQILGNTTPMKKTTQKKVAKKKPVKKPTKKLTKKLVHKKTTKKKQPKKAVKKAAKKRSSKKK